jgi:hypothetical protein
MTGAVAARTQKARSRVGSRLVSTGGRQFPLVERSIEQLMQSARGAVQQA